MVLAASSASKKLHALVRVAAIAAVATPILHTRFMAVGDLGSGFWEPVRLAGGWTS